METFKGNPKLEHKVDYSREDMELRAQKVLSGYQARNYKYLIFNKNTDRSFPAIEEPTHNQTKDNVICINIDSELITDEDELEAIECLIKSLGKYDDYGV